MSDLRAAFKAQSKKEKYGRSEDEKKILYCEVCEVPCANPWDLQEHFKAENHKKKERALMYGGFKVGELERIIQKVKCLKDYVDEPEREPLIGLEYVVESLDPLEDEPDYNCEMCGSRSKLVPMIVHLNGLKHRKAYISKHFPFTAKTRHPKEDIFQFLRRLALEIERYRGLKMFRVETFMVNDPDSSLSRELTNSLKRNRCDVGCLSDEEPQRKRTSRFEESFDGVPDAEDTFAKITRAQRVAEVLSKARPLNKAEAKAMERAKALNRAAALKSNAEKWESGSLTARQGFKTGELASRDVRNMGEKDSNRWELEEWNRFFLGGSTAERTSKQSSNIQKRESAEEAQNPMEAQRRAEIEQRIEAERRVEAEKQAQAERVAKAKRVAEALTQGRTGAKTQTAQNQQVKDAAGSNSTIVKVDQEKLARAKQVAEAITQSKPNLPKPEARQGATGKERLNRMPQDTSQNEISLENSSAAVRQNKLRLKPSPWSQAQTVSAPVTTPCLADESVVNLLENFLKQSIGQDEPSIFREETVNMNQDPLMQNQPPQVVTASRTWNLVPISQKQQIQQAFGHGRLNTESLMQNEHIQLAAQPPFYDPPASYFGSSLLNPLNFQTNNSARPLALSDSRGFGSFTGNRGFVSDYNRADSVSYSSVLGGGPTSYSSVLIGSNYQGAMYNSSSINQSSQGYPLSSLSSSYSGNADRAPRLYKDGIGEMAPTRAMAQKSTFKPW